MAKETNKIKKVKLGRPTKFSITLAREIALDISEGVTPEVSAADRGIHPATFYDWMQKGKDGIEPFSEFSELVTRARFGLRKFVEQRIFVENPTFYARHSPNMREKDGIEGWSGYEKNDVNIQVVTVSSIVDGVNQQLLKEGKELDILNYDEITESDEIKYIGENGNGKSEADSKD
jgi:hypothetical protein